jgi:hypothetical protein
MGSRLAPSKRSCQSDNRSAAQALQHSPSGRIRQRLKYLIQSGRIVCRQPRRTNASAGRRANSRRDLVRANQDEPRPNPIHRQFRCCPRQYRGQRLEEYLRASGLCALSGKGSRQESCGSGEILREGHNRTTAGVTALSAALRCYIDRLIAYFEIAGVESGRWRRQQGVCAVQPEPCDVISITSDGTAVHYVSPATALSVNARSTATF